MVVNEVNGWVLGWEEENEMWFAGCQSLVAILMVKGKLRRVLMRGMMSRPLGTAKLPFCEVM